MTAGGEWVEEVNRRISKAKAVVDLIKKAFPNISVKVIGIPISSCHGGLGWSYGTMFPLCDYYDIVHYTMELNLAYEAWTLEPDYKGFAEFVNLSGQFDSDYAYPSTQKSVNVRSKITERIDTNAVHPCYEGYMQIADAVFRNIVCSFLSK